jgi:hypothetical protein
MAAVPRLVYIMVGRIYKAARVISERDGTCVVAVEDLAGNQAHFAAEAGVDPRSGLPMLIEHHSARAA